MAKMPLSLIHDMPIQKTLQFKATEQLRGDISTTDSSISARTRNQFTKNKMVKVTKQY
jgi:hypothetical protein